MAIPTRADVDDLVRKRLASDPGFRETLLANPRAAISGLIGMPLPEVVNVEVHEESLTHVHLVIPAGRPKGEIADADLELVAGGGMCWDDCAACDGPTRLL